jgi:DNA-binding IclR family transcriptional regulator
VGTTFPLAAPIAPLFVAWGTEAEQTAWLERGRRLTGTTDRALGQAELAAVRELGYQATTGRAASDRFERAVTGGTDPSGLSEVLRGMQERGPEPGLHAPVDELTEVTSLAAPVRDRDGRVVLVLHISLTGAESAERLRTCLDRLLAGAARASALLSAAGAGPTSGTR